jgi:hypothetical protein
MALGLALPAMTFAQDDARPPRRDGPGQRQFNGGGDAGQRPPGNRDGVPGPEMQRQTPPLIGALDANHDGVIDEDEIKNAAEALRKLDKNGDGKLTMDELRPPRGDGPRADARPDGDRFQPRDENRGPAEGAPRRNARPPEDR